MAIETARELEERLLGLAHPSEAEIISPGDDDTPVWHLLTMAEVYRCTGLMQLYRVFPDLLFSRLPQTSASSKFQFPGSTTSTSTSRDLFFPVDLDSMNLSAFANHSPETTAQNPKPTDTTTPSTTPIPPHHPTTPSQNQNPPLEEPDRETLYNTWLTEFATTTLSRLKTIPLESRTRCLQPFLLVASCSELRLPRLSQQADTNDQDQGQVENDNDGNLQASISMEAIEVSRTRQFILGRLNNFMHVLPPKPIRVCLKLVNEVWRRMDAGRDDVFWVDVMMDNRWETTMG
jgi:hypothetical protein